MVTELNLNIMNKEIEAKAEEILDNYYKTGMHWKSVNRKYVIEAMLEFNTKALEASKNDNVEGTAEIAYNNHPNSFRSVKAAFIAGYESALKGIDLDRVVCIPTWVKASERMPEKEGRYCIKRLGEVIIADATLFRNGLMVFTTPTGMTWKSYKEFLWLDESGKTTIGELINHK
jgi:hypothetical protein